MLRQVDDRCKNLIQMAERSLNQRLALLSLWQELAENFYPERADFTVNRTLGQDFAANLATSYPIMVRQEFSNTLGYMMRPPNDDWVGIKTNEGVEDKDIDAKRYLEMNEVVMRRAMADRLSQFSRATKEADNDYPVFGQAIISYQLNRHRSAMLYRNWHPRDVAWEENAEGQIDNVFRAWKTTGNTLKALFGNIAPALEEKMKKNRYCEVNCLHIVLPAENYEAPVGKKWRTPFVSIYIDRDNMMILEEIGVNNLMYVIPRWQTVSGSQYAYSPLTVAALPDARLLQTMTFVLLEAGEKGLDPPTIAKEGIMRGDYNAYAGGLTLVNLEEDQRLRDAIDIFPIDKSGFQFGYQLRTDTITMLRSAFMLDKIELPLASLSREATATEVDAAVKKWIRQNLPIFAPIEQEYTGALCDGTYNLLRDNGAFGSKFDIPDSLRGQDIQFTFKSPLTGTVDSQKAQRFQEARAIIAEAIALDPSSAGIIDVRKALRDALGGADVPAEWMRSDEEMDAIAKAVAQKQSSEQLLSQIGQGADAAAKIGTAAQALQPLQGGQ